MSAAARTHLRHPLLDARGVAHGFGLRNDSECPGLLRPRQVHGAEVAEVVRGGALHPEAADAVVSIAPGVNVAIVTADCVPILAASESGGAVAAIHAGWRGLAAGVVARGVEALRARSGRDESLVAVIGPHIGVCCYEVDAPVWNALRTRFPQSIDASLRPSRSGHARLDLGSLVREELRAHGIDPAGQGDFAGTCTSCDPEKFHSYRRDGPKAGRLVHRIAARGAPGAARVDSPEFRA